MEGERQRKETREGKGREEKIISMLEGVRTSVRLKPSPVINTTTWLPHISVSISELCLQFLLSTNPILIYMLTNRT